MIEYKDKPIIGVDDITTWISNMLVIIGTTATVVVVCSILEKLL